MRQRNAAAATSNFHMRSPKDFGELECDSNVDSGSTQGQVKMSAYKSFSKQKADAGKKDADEDSKPKNRQRVLMLSSRGVTYR